MNKSIAITFVWLSMCGQAWAAGDAQREQLRQERKAIDAEATKREAECRKQFVVTACLDKVRIETIEAKQVIRSKEIELDATERRQKADAHERRLAAKAAAAEQKKGARPGNESHGNEAASAVSSDPSRLAEEDRKRAGFESRQREITEHREAVEKRNAKRSGRKPPVPLPVPVASEASR